MMLKHDAVLSKKVTLIIISILLQNLKSGLILWKFGTLPPALSGAVA
jgi:hypothetical protein